MWTKSKAIDTEGFNAEAPLSICVGYSDGSALNPELVAIVDADGSVEYWKECLTPEAADNMFELIQLEYRAGRKVLTPAIARSKGFITY